MIAYLCLGSNIGDRLAFLQQAQWGLEDHPQIRVLKYSPIYQTEHWPKTDTANDHPEQKKGQKAHLNQMVCIETDLDAPALLKEILAIEKRIGAEKIRRWGAREIDIDLLLYGEEIIELPDLKIPHPRMGERQFVLIPLLDIAPDLKDPVSGRPYSDILQELKREDDHGVKRFL